MVASEAQTALARGQARVTKPSRETGLAPSDTVMGKEGRYLGLRAQKKPARVAGFGRGVSLLAVGLSDLEVGNR